MRKKQGGQDPVARFVELFEIAKREEAFDATAMSLATATASGRPSVRVVLLKRVDERGFVFFTNYGSRKARELDANPYGALACYWPASERQARIEGPVKRLPADESDAYFASRPRGSQLAALTSRQSEPLPSYTELTSRFLKLQWKHGTGEIARPEFWGGYLLEPQRMEFWQNRLHRMHERFLYLLGDDGWTKSRLYP